MKGQALVETALVLPLFLFLLLGMVEVGNLFWSLARAQTAADVLADVAAYRMATEPGESWQTGWEATLQEEASEADCDLESWAAEFPDTTHDPGDRVRISIRCRYHQLVRGLWPGLVLEARGSAVVGS